MNNHRIVTAWHEKIIAVCRGKLQRTLTEVELEFILSRGGFLALEMIGDTVNSLEAPALAEYLNSESKTEQAPATKKTISKLHVARKIRAGVRGVHFALSNEDVSALRAIENDVDRLSFLQEDIEERYLMRPRIYVAESDKAWDAIHRAFTKGYLSWGGGEYPLNHVVLGGESLYAGSDYIMSLKTPEQVAEISGVIDSLSEDDFKRRFKSIPQEYYIGSLDDEGFSYTWHWFQAVCELYRRATREERHVLFTVAQ